MDLSTQKSRPRYGVNLDRSNNLNSAQYWESRFKTGDWHFNGGEQQSAYFMRLLISALPDWLAKATKEKNWRVADWGCACGDGTEKLLDIVSSPSHLTGIDFSESAIVDASKKYAPINFRCEDWISAQPMADVISYDMIVSSNTLEHFSDPISVLETIVQRAKSVVAILIPYREEHLIPEHMLSFYEGNIPSRIGERFSLISSTVINCKKHEGSQWPGEQILLVYGTQEIAHEKVQTLQDSKIESEDVISLLQSVDNSHFRENAISEQLDSVVRRLTQANRDLDQIRTGLGPLSDPKNFWFRVLRLFVGGFFFKALKSRVPYDWKVKFYAFKKALLKSRVRTARNYGRLITHDEFSEVLREKLPSFRGVFIQEVCIDWYVPLFQRPQQIALAMAKIGYLVIYKTPNVVDEIDGFLEVSENVWATNQTDFSLRGIEDKKHVVRSYYSTSYALSRYLPTSRRENEHTIYEYIDHIDPEISGSDPQFIKLLNEQKELAFNGAVDAVIASSKILMNEALAEAHTTRVGYIPNGVNVAHYRQAEMDLGSPLPSELEKFLRRHDKVVGYFGAIAPWLCYETLNHLVTLRPDIGFIFIGPDYNWSEKNLPRSTNFYYAGTVDYKILPRYARRFDVCLIPFKSGEIAKTTSPLKLFEYFALEKPVVVTSDMLECIGYDGVLHGSNYLELNKMIDRAFELKDDVSFKAKLAKLADQNDWTVRAEELVRFLKNSRG